MEGGRKGETGGERGRKSQRGVRVSRGGVTWRSQTLARLGEVRRERLRSLGTEAGTELRGGGVESLGQGPGATG